MELPHWWRFRSHVAIAADGEIFKTAAPKNVGPRGPQLRQSAQEATSGAWASERGLARPADLARRARATPPTSQPLPTPVPLSHALYPILHLPLRHPLRPGFHCVVVPARGRLSPLPGIVTPPFATMKLPTLPKLSNPIQRRPDGKLTIVGLTPMEWCTLAASLM